MSTTTFAGHAAAHRGNPATLRADIAECARLEGEALAKRYFGAFGAYRRLRCVLENELARCEVR